MNTWLPLLATSFPSIEINETFPIFNKTRETEITLAGEITETTSTETPKQYNKTYNGLPLFTASDLQRPYRSKNIWRDTNNPGNLLNGQGNWVIGIYKSPNGNYYSVFATIQEGYQALIQEIDHRKTKVLKSRQSLLDFLGGRVLGRNGKLDPNSYYYSIALAIAGKNRSIQEIETETLAKIIMMGEATREAYQSGGKNLQYLIK